MYYQLRLWKLTNRVNAPLIIRKRHELGTGDSDHQITLGVPNGPYIARCDEDFARVGNRAGVVLANALLVDFFF